MQILHNQSSWPTADPTEHISEQLLKDICGEVLLISLGKAVICKRSAGNLRNRALSWLNIMAEAGCTRFIIGRVSEKGGRFQVVTREQALELIALWLGQELQKTKTD